MGPTTTLLLLASSFLLGQETHDFRKDLKTFPRAERPFLPGTCDPGEEMRHTIEDVVYRCTSPNTWEARNGSGGAAPGGVTGSVQTKNGSALYGDTGFRYDTLETPDPSAPQVVATCPDGCDTEYGYLVTITDFVGWTGPSGITTVMNNATLDGTHFNTFTLPDCPATSLVLVERKQGPQSPQVFVQGCGVVFTDNAPGSPNVLDANPQNTTQFNVHWPSHAGLNASTTYLNFLFSGGGLAWGAGAGQGGIAVFDLLGNTSNKYFSTTADPIISKGFYANNMDMGFGGWWQSFQGHVHADSPVSVTRANGFLGCNAVDGEIVFNLPDPATFPTVPSGVFARNFTMHKDDASINKCTWASLTGQNINGESTFSIDTKDASSTVYWNGTQWATSDQNLFGTGGPCAVQLAANSSKLVGDSTVLCGGVVSATTISPGVSNVGTPGAATYSYTIAAVTAVGEGPAATPTATFTSQDPPDGTNYNHIATTCDPALPAGTPVNIYALNHGDNGILGYLGTVTCGMGFDDMTGMGDITRQAPAIDHSIGIITADVTAGQRLKGGVYATGSNCSSDASPASCGSASAGSVVIAAGATSVVVNTSVVAANSQILLTPDTTLSSKLGVTCNNDSVIANFLPIIGARSPGASFEIDITGPVVANPACYSYFIVN